MQPRLTALPMLPVSLVAWIASRPPGQSGGSLTWYPVSASTPPETPAAGPNLCPDCSGSGEIDGYVRENCAGTGQIESGLSGG